MPDYCDTTFHVRYAETDKRGIVHHRHYLTWMEEGRSAYLRALGYSYVQFEAEGISLAVTEAKIRFLLPARYDRRVKVRTYLTELKSRQVSFAYEVADVESSELLATGQTRHSPIDRQGRITRLPEHWRR